MRWIEPLLAFVLAVLFGVMLVGVLRWRHPRRPDATVPSLAFVFLLLFPLIWVAALWSGPVGPTIYGAAVIPALLIGLLVALVLATLAEPREPALRDTASEMAEADTAAAVFGGVFWALIIIAAIGIVTGYFV